MDIYQIIAIILIIFVILLCIVLSSRTRIVRTYRKYMRLDNQANITGKQLAFFARKQLELTDLEFALTKEELGDAYNYKYKTLILSEQVCQTASLASLTIVAHELGHALQHKENSVLFMTSVFTNKIARLTNIFILPLLILGVFAKMFSYPTPTAGDMLILAALVLFGLQILNKILDIPLEYNASNRGLKLLKEYQCLSPNEHHKAKKLLKIAAQTYIASLLDNIIIIKRRKRKKR